MLLTVCVLYFLVVLVRLSVPVQVTDSKDSSESVMTLLLIRLCYSFTADTAITTTRGSAVIERGFAAMTVGPGPGSHAKCICRY